MLGPTHVLIGIGSGIALCKSLPMPISAPELLCLIVGSLAPDIDGDGSITKPGTIMRGFFPRGVARLLDELTSLVAAIVRAIFGHRGFFHWLSLPLCLIILAYLSSSTPLFWFAWGYLWHLLADLITPMGIPLLAPLNFNKYSLRLCKTGSLLEKLIFLLLLLAISYFGFDMLPQQTQLAFKQLKIKLLNAH